MELINLTFALSKLPAGDLVAVTVEDCARLFAPGVMSLDGRRKIYSFADQMRCSVEWGDDHSIRFVKRPSFRDQTDAA